MVRYGAATVDKLPTKVCKRPAKHANGSANEV